jgi:hypothetical protein
MGTDFGNPNLRTNPTRRNVIVIELVLGFAPYFVFEGKSVTKNTSEVVTIDVGLADMAVRGFRFGPCYWA